MILSFADKETAAFYEKGRRPRSGWSQVSDRAAVKLDMVAAAKQLSDLASPPGNRLEPLRGDREGQHSIRINDKWRICFVWTDAGPHSVEVTDYH